MEKDLVEIHTPPKQQNKRKFWLPQNNCFTAPVPPGRFLFILKPQQVSYRYSKVLGDLVSGSCSQVLLAAGLEIGDDAPADPQLGAHLAGGDVALGAEGRDAII